MEETPTDSGKETGENNLSEETKKVPPDEDSELGNEREKSLSSKEKAIPVFSGDYFEHRDAQAPLSEENLQSGRSEKIHVKFLPGPMIGRFRQILKPAMSAFFVASLFFILWAVVVWYLARCDPYWPFWQL